MSDVTETDPPPPQLPPPFVFGEQLFVEAIRDGMFFAISKVLALLFPRVPKVVGVSPLSWGRTPTTPETPL